MLQYNGNFLSTVQVSAWEEVSNYLLWLSELVSPELHIEELSFSLPGEEQLSIAHVYLFSLFILTLFFK